MDADGVAACAVNSTVNFNAAVVFKRENSA